MAVFNVNIDNSPVRFDSGSMFGGMGKRMDVEDSAILKVKGNLQESFDPDTGLPIVTITDLVQTNSVYSFKMETQESLPALVGTVVVPQPPTTFVTSKPADGTYRLVWQGKINIKERWDDVDGNSGQFNDLGNTFSTTGESVASDYKLDWATSQISSLAFQVPSLNATPVMIGEVITDWSSWTTIREVGTTSSFLDLPFRANEYDEDWVSDKRDDYHFSIFTNNNNNNNTQGKFENAFEYQSVVYNWQWPFGTTNAQYLFGNDSVNGSRNDDVIRGYAGDDLLRGNAGDDLLYADFGRDQLFGGPGNDVLVFSGSASSWDVSNFKYRSSTIELAVGGSGSDYFVFRPSEINWTARDDVYYDTHLPNLMNGKFKYNVVNLSDVTLNLANGKSIFRLASNGDIQNSSGTVVKPKAFSESNNPFQKFQPADVTVKALVPAPAAAVAEKWGVYTKDNKGLDVEIEKVAFSTTGSLPFDYYINDLAVVKVPKNSNPTLVAPTTAKAGAFTATNSPYLYTQGLVIDTDDSLSYIATGTIRKGFGNAFTESAPFSTPVFISKSPEVTLNERVGGDELDTYFATSTAMYQRAESDDWHYNPFMSQNQNSTWSSTSVDAHGVSALTQRIRVQDFKIGSDTLDLSAFGLTKEILALPANAALLKDKSGTAFLTELSKVLAPEGLVINAAKTAWTSGNTSLFIKETKDTNANNTPNDTLLEIQLVGINISSVNGRFFGEVPNATAADMLPTYLTY